jgi:hypothetical protein
MFHGGTNFGFNAGANSMDEAPFYAPDVTSYGISLSPKIIVDFTKIIIEEVAYSDFMFPYRL